MDEPYRRAHFRCEHRNCCQIQSPFYNTLGNSVPKSPLRQHFISNKDTSTSSAHYKMRFSTIMTAAFGPAGVHCIVSGFLDSCSNVSVTNLEGDPGRSMMLQAYCKVLGADEHWTQLDLNTCFGWSADSCNFLSPPSGHFTDSCTTCFYGPSGGGDGPDGMFACRGPCNAEGEVLRMFGLSKSTVLLTPSSSNGRGFSLLTRTWQTLTSEIPLGTWPARGARALSGLDMGIAMVVDWGCRALIVWQQASEPARVVPWHSVLVLDLGRLVIQSSWQISLEISNDSLAVLWASYRFSIWGPCV